VVTVAERVNALANAAEALWSVQANPVTDALAVPAITAIGHALPVVVQDPRNRAARSELLRGARLAGTGLGAVGTGLHHQVLGELLVPHPPGPRATPRAPS
jgi:maleylacetate reductase